MQTTPTDDTRRTPPVSRAVHAEAYAWGYNNRGGLGIGSVARAPHPVPSPLPAKTIDVQGGTDFTVALTATGQVWTWGGNDFGQLGVGDRRTSLRVQQVDLPPVASISVGESHVLAATAKGHLYTWGRNHRGQLGDGTRTDRAAPTKVMAIHAGSRIATGNACSMIVHADGTVSMWGQPIAATEALSEAELGHRRPLHLPKSVHAEHVEAGQRHLVVLTRDGDLLSYGVDFAGKPAPQRVTVHPSWGPASAISAGDNHTVALTESGVVVAWGANHSGQLGMRDTTSRREPLAVHLPSGAGRVVEIVAAGDFTLARTEKHRVYAWGHGVFGQTGNGTVKNQSRPQPVTLPHGTRVIGIHAGRLNGLARTDPNR